jgi:hypothetical protein
VLQDRAASPTYPPVPSPPYPSHDNQKGFQTSVPGTESLAENHSSDRSPNKIVWTSLVPPCFLIKDAWTWGSSLTCPSALSPCELRLPTLVAVPGQGPEEQLRKGLAFCCRH